MIWKIVLVALQVAGVFGAINLTPVQKQSLHSFLTAFCRRYGSADKAAAAETGVLQFVGCLGELFDFDNIEKETMTALTNGSVHELVEGYCEKAPQVKKCILEGLERVMPCAPAILRVDQDIQTNATDSLLQWVCGDKGDKMLMFFTENGKQCIIKSMESIRDCTRDLKSSITKNLDIKTKCTNYEDMTNCILSTLLFCQTQVTALLFNSVFNYIREISPCKDYIKPFDPLNMKVMNPNNLVGY